MSKITQYSQISNVQPDDLIVVIDTHDTSMSSSGTTKKMAFNQLSPSTIGASRTSTIVVAASNSSAAGKAAADYVCSGTSTTGGDEVTINAALTAGAGGRVVLLEGTYWRTTPIINDHDYTTLEGQGPGTIIAVPTSVVTPSGYASIIFGNTRTLTDASIRHLRVQPQGSGTNLISGSGHGIAFRSNNGRLDDVTVQSPSNDGWRIGGCTNSSLAVTVTQAVDTPAALTSETWTTSATLSLPLPAWAKVTTSSYSGTPGNDDTIETVAITAIGSGNVTVVRGWDATPISAIASNAVLTPIDTVFEIGGTNLDTVFPGVAGMVLEASSANCEFIRCVTEGGWKLGTPRGTHGIRMFGGLNKLLYCHPYFNQQDGLHVDCRGVSGLGAMQVIGGEYETNGGVGISLNSTYNAQMSLMAMYANYNENVLLSFCDRTIVQGVTSQYSSGSASAGFQHVFAGNCYRTKISGGLFEFGEQTAIVISGTSVGTLIQGNTIVQLDAASGSAYSIRLSGCTNVDVTGNVVDRPINEDSTAGGDFNRIWGNRMLNTNNGTGTTPNAVTINGAHTVSYENLGQSDKVFSNSSTLTAILRKTYLVSAPSGGTVVTLPGSGALGIALAAGSQSLTLPQATLTLASTPSNMPPSGQLMVPVTGGTWTPVSYSSISGAVLSGCFSGSGTTTTGNVYLLPPDGEEFSIVQTDASNTTTLNAPPGSLINNGSSVVLSVQRMYRVVLSGGNWNVY